VASIEDKMRDARLRWYGHIRRRPWNAPVRRCEKMGCPEYKRSRVGRRRVAVKLLDTI